MMNKPPPLKGLDIRVPTIIPIQGKGFINQGSTLPSLTSSLRFHQRASQNCVPVRQKPQAPNSQTEAHSPLEVDRIWGKWGPCHNIPKAIFYLLHGDSKPIPPHSSQATTHEEPCRLSALRAKNGAPGEKQGGTWCTPAISPETSKPLLGSYISRGLTVQLTLHEGPWAPEAHFMPYFQGNEQQVKTTCSRSLCASGKRIHFIEANGHGFHPSRRNCAQA